MTTKPQKELPEDDLITVAEAARITHQRIATIRQAIYDGDLPGRAIGLRQKSSPFEVTSKSAALAFVLSRKPKKKKARKKKSK